MTAPDTAPQAPQPLFGLLPVLGAGLLSSGLALALVWWLNRTFPELNVMGWYMWFVVPIGSLIVGIAAGSGYGLASWITGARTTAAVVTLVALLQACVYFTAQYVEFHSLELAYEDGSKVEFWTYFDVTTRAFAFKQKGPEEPEPLGALGYGIRALEITGFVLGGMVVPIGLWTHPYCGRCARYKRRRDLGCIAASAAKAGLLAKKPSQGEQLRAEAAAKTAGALAVENLLKLAQEPDSVAFRAALAAATADTKQASKLPKHFEIRVTHCPSCHEGDFEILLRETEGNDTSVTELGSIPMPPDRIRDVLGV